jgi:hypothetical protein
MDFLPAAAELVEQGATPDGDDKNSVIAAAGIAIDLAAESEGGLDVSAVSAARIIVTEFADDGDVIVYSVEESAADKVRECLKGDGVKAVTVAAKDIEEVFSEARKIESGEDEGEDRESVPPPAPAA